MLAMTDWPGILGGIAAIVAAIFAGLVNLRMSKLQTGQQVIQQQQSEVHAAVTTPPSSPSVGQLAADVANTVQTVADDVQQVKTVLNGHDQTDPPHAAGAAGPPAGGSGQ